MEPSRSTLAARPRPASSRGAAEAPPRRTRDETPDEPSRRLRKKERTRREIYTAALRLFAQRGFESVSVEHVCEAADVARATFFLHFPSKASLLFEFSRVLAGELAERLADGRGSAVDEIRRMATLFAERWLEHGPVMAAMLRELLRTPEAFLALGSEGRDLREVVEDLFRRGQERGELNPRVDPRLATAIFFSTSFSILSGSVFREGELAPQAVRDQFLEAFLHGLAPPSDGTPRPRVPHSSPSTRRRR